MFHVSSHGRNFAAAVPISRVDSDIVQDLLATSDRQWVTLRMIYTVPHSRYPRQAGTLDKVLAVSRVPTCHTRAKAMFTLHRFMGAAAATYMYNVLVNSDPTHHMKLLSEDNIVNLVVWVLRRLNLPETTAMLDDHMEPMRFVLTMMRELSITA